MAMISVHDLYKSFGDLRVLDGVNLEAEAGEVVCIIGKSGAGKSTFLRCLNLLETPEQGTIEIDGRFIDAQSCTESQAVELRKKTAMVFQAYNVFKNKKVIDNVMMPMTRVQKMDKVEAREKAIALLERVGLLDKMDEFPSRLSGGQQQRVGIARALAVDPKVMLLDEPTSSLDPDLVSGILALIRDLALEHSRTMICVTHEMRFAKEVADRVLLMENGKISKEVPLEELENLWI